jgi:hypothetical protein
MRPDLQSSSGARDQVTGSATGKPARRVAPSPGQVFALQRLAGNRASTRMLARWTAHPDKAKKGAMLPDSVAAELLRFSPPQNK